MQPRITPQISPQISPQRHRGTEAQRRKEFFFTTEVTEITEFLLLFLFRALRVLRGNNVLLCVSVVSPQLTVSQGLGSRRRRPHRFAAIRTAHVVSADGAPAVTTARGQGMAALRTIAEVRSDLGTAVGARYQQRLAQQEVRNKAQGLGYENHQQRPQQRIHAATLGVRIHVADHQDDDANDNATEYADQHQKRHRGYVSFEVRQESQQADLYEQEPQHCDNSCDSRNNGEFATKVRLYLDLVHRFSPSCSPAKPSMS